MEKSSKTFEQTIKAYLDKRAETDSLFAEKYRNEKKNIKKFSVVQSRGVCNKNTERHEEILELMNEHMKLIKKYNRKTA